MDKHLADQLPESMAALRKKLMQVVEELRIRRTMDAETEEKLDELITEKHAIRSELEMATKEIEKLKEEREQEIESFRKNQQEQYRKMHVEKEKLKCSNTVLSKELKSRMDEVRSLQLSKYSVEKQLKEQTSQLNLELESQSSNSARITTLQTQVKTLQKRLHELEHILHELTTNVSHMKELQQKLETINKHNDCEINSLKAEVCRLREQLSEAQCKIASHPAEIEQIKFQKQRRIVKLENDVQTNALVIKNLEDQLNFFREENKDLQSKLQESSSLIVKHVESIAHHESDKLSLSEQLSDANSSLSDVKAKLEEKSKQLFIENEAHNAALEIWKQEESALKNKLSSLEENHESLSKSFAELEGEKQESDEQIVNQLNQIAALHAELNKPKTDAEIQTEIITCDIDIQTDVLGKTVFTQTDFPGHDVTTQTIVYTINTASQTELHQRNMSAQTELRQHSVTSQTESHVFTDVGIQTAPDICDAGIQTIQSSKNVGCQTLLCNIAVTESGDNVNAPCIKPTPLKKVNERGDANSCDDATRATTVETSEHNSEPIPETAHEVVSDRIVLFGSQNNTGTEVGGSELKHYAASPLSGFTASLKGLSLHKADEASPQKKRRRYRAREVSRSLQSSDATEVRTSPPGSGPKVVSEKSSPFTQAFVNYMSYKKNRERAGSAEEQNKPAGILSTPASKRTRRGKSVTFSTVLETCREFENTEPHINFERQWLEFNKSFDGPAKENVPGIVGNEIEESLFSDEEAEQFELRESDNTMGKLKDNKLCSKKQQ